LGEGVKLIYIDSSCLVKVFRPEPESAAVMQAIAQQEVAIITTLVELEVLVQLKADYLAGNLSRPRSRQLEAQFSVLRNQPPYEFRAIPASLFRTALRQHRNSGDVHCRTLDRLHVAAMEELGVSRLMTHDERQANAARQAGLEVFWPNRH